MSGDHDLDLIEAELERDRAELDLTLNAARSRLRILTLAAGSARLATAGAGLLARGTGRTAGRLARANPVGLALLGLGLAWCLMGTRRSARR